VISSVLQIHSMQVLYLHPALHRIQIINNLTHIMVIIDKLQLMQWNCCGIRGKLPYLQSVSQTCDILSIQESLLWPHNNCWLNCFNLIRRDITSFGERDICILVRNNLSYSVCVCNRSFFFSFLVGINEYLTITNP